MNATWNLPGADAPICLDRVILGTSRYGNGRTEEEAHTQMSLFVDELGGTTLDTATVYAEKEPGISRSEQIIGSWLRGRDRKGICIISKGCCYKLNAPHVPRLTPQALREDLYQSLEALGTDYVDLFLLHRDNPEVPVGEMVDAMAEQIDKGLIRAGGVSNWWGGRIAQANDYAKAHGKPLFAASEIQWSLVPQTAGQELMREEHNAWMTEAEFAAYRQSQMPVLAYFAQARGYVSKFLAGEAMQGVAQEFDSPVSRERAGRAGRLAQELHCSPAQIALAYLLCSGLPGAVLVGASSEGQLRESVQSAGIMLTPAQIAFLRGA